jgi:multidrug efflux pump subunit AcrA (membrane-fusion protein)
MNKATKIVLPVAVVAIAALIMFGLLSLREDPPKRPPEDRAKIVTTAVIEMQTVPTVITAYGRVTSSDPIVLFAEAPGTLEPGDVPFKPAQAFDQGDVLIKIDDRQTQLNMNTTKSDLMAALTRVLPEIKADFPDEYPAWQTYFDELDFDSDLAPLPEAVDSRVRMFLSRFSIYKLYFTILDLEIYIDKHTLRAPFDGTIVSTALRAGSTANKGARLGEIISLEDLEVAVEVAAEDIAWIDRNQPITMTSTEIGGTWTGRIVRVGSDIDERTQTVAVHIAVDNSPSEDLLSGAFLQAHIVGKGVTNAFPIPPRALYEDRFVYIIVDGLLEKREVVIERRERDAVIISSGLGDGDVLVTEVMQGVESGMPARSRLDSPEEGR